MKKYIYSIIQATVIKYWVNSHVKPPIAYTSSHVNLHCTNCVTKQYVGKTNIRLRMNNHRSTMD